MLARQLRLLLILGAALAALLLILAFGPEPTAQEPDKVAERTPPPNDGLDTGLLPEAEYRIVGDPSVDWYVIEETEAFPLDPSDPDGPVIVITTEDACWMPKADGADLTI